MPLTIIRLYTISLAVVLLADLMMLFGVIPIEAVAGSPTKVNKPGKASSKASAAILKQTIKYDRESYDFGGGHSGNNSIKNYRGSGLDCSGLINLAVYKVTGIYEDRTSDTFIHSSHWTKVKPDSAAAGDIIFVYGWRRSGGIGHVAIIVKNLGHRKYKIFEAWTVHTAQSDQIHYSTTTYGSFGSVGADGVLRFRR